MPAMPPEEPQPAPEFWEEVLPNVATGLILLAAGGIAFICITVPRQLDLVLENQKAINTRAAAAEDRIDKAEGAIIGIDRRVTRLEAR
jgi:hypothetical protein